MSAFAEGCHGSIVPPDRLYDGPAATYGILRGTGNVIKQAEKEGREYHYIDHGYIKAGHYEGFYRITKNGRQMGRLSEFPEDRFKRIGVRPKEWNKKGSKILIIPFTGAIADFYGVDSDTWLAGVISYIRTITDREIYVKPKGDEHILEALKDTFILITHSSNAAVDALLNGIPVCTLGESACTPMSTDLASINTPAYPDREPWLHALAYHQLTLEEMRRGHYNSDKGFFDACIYRDRPKRRSCVSSSGTLDTQILAGS